MTQLNLENIWGIYAKLFSKITPQMSYDLLDFGASNTKGFVLDAGCGVGKAIPHLIKNPNLNSILAIDSNNHMIQEAKLLVSKLNTQIPIEIINSDIINYGYNSSFDSILSLNVVYTLNNPQSFFEKSYDLLSRGGKFIVSSPNNFMDMKKLEEIVDKEFNFNDETYKKFKECNHFLVSQNFKPKLYDLQEISKILENIGFEITYSDNIHYCGHNFTVVCKKN